MTLTVKRLLLWSPIMGFVGYFFSAKTATIDWQLVALSICAMMSEAAGVVLIIDRRTRRFIPTVVAVIAGLCSVASLMVTGSSFCTYALIVLTLIFLSWTSVFLRSSQRAT